MTKVVAKVEADPAAAAVVEATTEAGVGSGGGGTGGDKIGCDRRGHQDGGGFVRGVPGCIIRGVPGCMTRMYKGCTGVYEGCIRSESGCTRGVRVLEGSDDGDAESEGDSGGGASRMKKPAG